MLVVIVTDTLGCVCVAHSTSFFDEINRVVAYVAIWVPLWFRMLSSVSPALTDEELEAREKREFQRHLDRLVQDEDEVDE